MPQPSNNLNSGDSAHDEQLARRRLEGEVYLLQSDRARIERHSNELDAEIRTLEKAINERTLDLEDRKADRNRLIQKVQDIDAEIVRVKRSSYKHKS